MGSGASKEKDNDKSSNPIKVKDHLLGAQNDIEEKDYNNSPSKEKQPKSLTEKFSSGVSKEDLGYSTVIKEKRKINEKKDNRSLNSSVNDRRGEGEENKCINENDIIETDEVQKRSFDKNVKKNYIFSKFSNFVNTEVFQKQESYCFSKKMRTLVGKYESDDDDENDGNTVEHLEMIYSYRMCPNCLVIEEKGEEENKIRKCLNCGYKYCIICMGRGGDGFCTSQQICDLKEINNIERFYKYNEKKNKQKVVKEVVGSPGKGEYLYLNLILRYGMKFLDLFIHENIKLSKVKEIIIDKLLNKFFFLEGTKKDEKQENEEEEIMDKKSDKKNDTKYNDEILKKIKIFEENSGLEINEENLEEIKLKEKRFAHLIVITVN